MRPILVALVASLAILPVATLVGAAPPGAVPIDMSDCAYMEIAVKVPAARVAPLMPSDFKLIVGVDGMNTILLSGGSCDHASSGSDQGTGSFVSFLSRIQEPDDLGLSGGVAVWFYRLAHYVGSGDIYRQVADAAGVDTVPVTALAVDLEPALSTITIQSADIDVRVLGTATPDLPTGGGGNGVRWREFHEVPAGYAVLEASLVNGPGAGTTAAAVTASDGSLWGNLAGPASAGPTSYGRHIAIRDGWMGILPRPS